MTCRGCGAKLLYLAQAEAQKQKALGKGCSLGGFIFAFEMIGTVAFAVSGSMTAVRKNMDLFGVMILGVITACGGGLTRDIILGITPPALFGTPKYVTVAAATAILVFIPGIRRWLMKSHRGFERILLLMDSIGLGVFTMVGMQAAYGCGVECSTFLAVSVGVITGVGGGVMRDVMAGDRPYIFVKHIYACAAILGAMLFAVLRGRCGDTVAILAGAALVILIRLLSAHFRWSLPRAHEIEENR